MKKCYSALSLFCLSTLAMAKTTVHPNVILIYADDMGKGMLSAYGQRMLATPHIDALIHQGTSFSRSYGCMVSAASRASLLTGYHDCRIAHNTKWDISGGSQYVSYYNEKTNEVDREGIRQREAEIDRQDVRLGDGDYYLAQVFKQAHYVTGEIGKLEYGWTATTEQMKRHGWDYFYGYLDHVRCHGFYPPFLFESDSIIQIAGNTHRDCAKTQEWETPKTYANRWNMEGKNVYSQNLFSEKISNFIEQHKDTCFFLFHPTQLPHGPVMVPRVDPQIALNPHLTQIEKEYATMIRLLDDQVGRIMRQVDSLGIADRTIIIFASDNGHEIYYSQAGRINKQYSDTLGRRFDNLTYKYRSRAAGDVFNGNWGLAGLKRSNLEGGVRVPLALCGPGIPRGKERSDLVSVYDLLPTFADLLGVRLPVRKSGFSLLPLIRKGKHFPKDRYVVFSSYTGGALVTNEGWKVRRIQGKTELYNVLRDPKEYTELSAQFPARKAALESLLLRECGNDWKNGQCNY